MKNQDRRTFLKASGLAAVGLAAPAILRLGGKAWAANEIPVGIMYSLTGTTAIVEKSMNQCAQMAIAEINAKGGVLGRQLRAIIEDPASEPRIYSEKNGGGEGLEWDQSRAVDASDGVGDVVLPVV